MKQFFYRRRAFTLIELLVVIAIIGLLSTIAVISTSNARVKARDAKRLADVRQIITALNLYQDQYGCLPVTDASTCPGNGGYSEWNSGAWDYSSQGSGFLTFLQTAGIMAKVPVDPINNMTGDGTPAGSFAYRYFCYANGPSLGYWQESNGAEMWPLLRGTDSSYVCK
jgi:prepilin-type N-terminal cleavage/methylation domain-containing protein